MDRLITTRVVGHPSSSIGRQPARTPLILVVEDESILSDMFRSVSECLNVGVERMSTQGDLDAALREWRPMAVVAEMDAAGQDGCHVLMTIAAFDRDLPVLLITGADSALLGAIDAVEELWQLSAVVKWSAPGGVGPIVDFLFRAGRKGGCMRLMPT
ncbi:MAG: hypothetical protein WDN25_09375 [Acetobacteraceae bacterium]